MSAVMSLAWKEWREARWFLWIALVVFVVLPVVGGVEEMGHKHFEINALPWVGFLGGVLAVFVGVGITCRDFNGRLEDFWRSRPVSVTRWMLVKYFVGLAVVLGACVVPLAVELIFDQAKDAILFIAWFPFLWGALYGIGFLAGVLVRRTAHAAMLGLAGMLLVYFLPVVLPPLRWMNITTITDFITYRGVWPVVMGWQQLEFGAGMLGVAIVLLGLALLAVRRDWRIGFGRKLMYGSVSAAVLILFGSAAFQLGTNMPILKQADLRKGEVVQEIHYSGKHGYVLTCLIDDAHNHIEEDFRTINITATGIELGDAVRVWKPYLRNFYVSHAPADQRIIYHIDDPEADARTQEDVIAKKKQTTFFWLYVDQVDQSNDKAMVHLWDEDFDGATLPLLYASGERLYVIGQRLMVLDISKPLTPRVISDEPLDYEHQWAGNWKFGDEVLRIILPQVPGLTPRERLEAVANRVGFLEGDTLCQGGQDRFRSGGDGSNVLYTYQLKELKQDRAVFEKVGERRPTMLEGLFGVEQISDMNLQNGLLYVAEGFWRSEGNGRIDVFDARGKKALGMVGHFAAPKVNCVCPLPDGTALVGGEKVWLVGPPPRRARE